MCLHCSFSGLLLLLFPFLVLYFFFIIIIIIFSDESPESLAEELVEYGFIHAVSRGLIKNRLVY